MECAEVREEFSALLDGELCQEARAAVEAHLAQCAACLRELDKLKRVDALYRGISPQRAPVDFEQRLQAALSSAVVRFQPGRARTVRLWPVLAAAALFLLVVGGVLMTSGVHSPRFQMSYVPYQHGKAPLEGNAAQRAAAQSAPELPRAEQDRLRALGYLNGDKAVAPGAGAKAMSAPVPTPEPSVPVQAEKESVGREDKVAVKRQEKDVGQNAPGKPPQVKKAVPKPKGDAPKKREATAQKKAPAAAPAPNPEPKPEPTGVKREERFEVAAGPKPNAPAVAPESARVAEHAEPAPSAPKMAAEMPAQAPPPQSEPKPSKQLQSPADENKANAPSGGYGAGNFGTGGYGGRLKLGQKDEEHNDGAAKSSDVEVHQAHVEAKDMSAPAPAPPAPKAARRLAASPSPPKSETVAPQAAPPPPPSPAPAKRAAPEQVVASSVPEQAKEAAQIPSEKPSAEVSPTATQSDQQASQSPQPKSPEAEVTVVQLRHEVDQHPGDAAPRLKLAQALHKQGKDKEAIRILREVLRIDPKAVDGYIALGSIYAAQGKTAKAQEQFKQALDLDPANQRAQQALEKAKGQQKH